MARRGVKNIQATPKMVDDIKFASTAEADRYIELKILQAAGEISGLIVHPSFQLAREGVAVCYLNSEKIRKYTADFMYKDMSTGETIVEDVKGITTPVASLRMSIFRAFYPQVKLIVNKRKKYRKKRKA